MHTCQGGGDSVLTYIFLYALSESQKSVIMWLCVQEMRLREYTLSPNEINALLYTCQAAGTPPTAIKNPFPLSHSSSAHQVGLLMVLLLLFLSASCVGSGGAEVALDVYEQVRGSFREDEQTDTVLVRCYAEQGRVADALALIRDRVQQGSYHVPPSTHISTLHTPSIQFMYTTSPCMETLRTKHGKARAHACMV